MQLWDSDPLGVLNAMRRIPVPFRDIELPGDRYVRDQLSEAFELIGGPEYLFGDFGEGPGDPRYNVGAAPAIGPLSPIARYLGLNNALRGGGLRLAPSGNQYLASGNIAPRDIGRIREQRRAFRKGERFIGGLPEAESNEAAFAEYIARRAGEITTRARGRGRLIAERDQATMLAEELEDLMPERISHQMYETMSPESFRSFLSIIEDMGGQVRGGRWAGKGSPVQDFTVARTEVGDLLSSDMTEAIAAGDLRRAARLAALRWQYDRTPREMFGMQRGRYLSEGRGRTQKTVHRTEERAWAELRDNALKRSFREIMKMRRQAGRPRQGD